MQEKQHNLIEEASENKEAKSTNMPTEPYHQAGVE